MITQYVLCLSNQVPFWWNICFSLCISFHPFVSSFLFKLQTWRTIYCVEVHTGRECMTCWHSIIRMLIIYLQRILWRTPRRARTGKNVRTRQRSARSPVSSAPWPSPLQRTSSHIVRMHMTLTWLDGADSMDWTAYSTSRWSTLSD